jgi:type 1 glutamine amidotransferase
MINAFLRSGLLLLLTCLLGVGLSHAEKKPSKKKKAIRVLMVGGGSSHDFNRWYKQEDVATLEKDGLASVEYTDDPTTILAKLPQADVLFLTNNQPIQDDATRKAIFAHAEAGKGLVLAHPALWYNWKDWPEYNQQLVGGGSRGHDKYGNFEVVITNTKHPVTKGIPATFSLDDELYYYKIDPNGTPVEVLATAKSPKSGEVFPNLVVVKHPKTRIVGVCLGHDAASHTIEPYKSMIRNAVKWVAKKK